MVFAPLPTTAAWRHDIARDGFEVAYFPVDGAGARLMGCTTAVEEGATAAVSYDLIVDADWVTRRAKVALQSESGARQRLLESDGHARWRVDGEPAPWLDGCLDVDLESSAMTNTLPVHRMRLGVGDRADAPAAYVRMFDLGVERLEQGYRRIADAVAAADSDAVAGSHEPRPTRAGQRYEYRSLAFDFKCVLVFDESGLVLDYPGIAVRVA
ncbi:putative glycolipid-binding domain-containing protein [Streptomyces sp. ISL-90]|nr:putative glycolipid-binding domain-containing protein [Streptomyces sp. ISL-90]